MIKYKYKYKSLCTLSTQACTHSSIVVSGAWLTRVMTRGPGPGHVCVVIRLNQELRDLYSSVQPLECCNLTGKSPLCLYLSTTIFTSWPLPSPSLCGKLLLLLFRLFTLKEYYVLIDENSAKSRGSIHRI